MIHWLSRLTLATGAAVAAIAAATAATLGAVPAQASADSNLFASVDLNGTLAHGNGVTGVTHIGTGRYEVTFSADVRQCAYVATTINASSQALQVFTAGGHLGADGVYVETKNQGGGLTDGSFNLVVDCGLPGWSYAVVGYNADLVRSTPGVTLTSLGAGRYDVTFPADISRCAYLATVGDPGHGLVFNPGGVYTGSGSNPDLKPIRSNNYDAGLEWYFAKRSLLSAGLFYMDLNNYVAFGSETKSYITFNSQFQGQLVPYLLTVPVNAKGRVQGFELAYQQALGEYFGVAANYTYADGKQTSKLDITGDDRLVGTSKNTYNLSGYFENQQFSARVAYTYRSAFFSGLDRNSAFSQDAIGSLTASLQYAFNDMLSLSLDGENLNKPTLKYYALNKDQPRAFYRSGAQYYLTIRAKL